MKHRNSASSTAQLLGTLSFRAAHAVDEAVRSVADSDVLRAVDSAVGQVFYSAVFEPVYKRAWCAVAATWLTKRGIHFKHKAAVLGATVATSAEKTRTCESCGAMASRRPDRWMRLTKTTIILVTVAALAGFAGGYSSRAPNHPVEVAVARSPEIRRAIPVEPEIRKAIPVQTRKRK